MRFIIYRACRSHCLMPIYIYDTSALGVRHEKLGIKRRKEKLKFAKSFIKST